MAKNKLLESEEKTRTFLLSVESVNVMHQLAKSCILEKKKNKITTFASNICNNNNKNGKLVELYLDCIWINFQTFTSTRYTHLQKDLQNLHLKKATHMKC